jgi:hypothetical protein
MNLILEFMMTQKHHKNRKQREKKKKNSLKFSCVEEQKLNFHGSHGFSKGSLQKVE